MATENWDAPIILTTAVQFFESLFANRSSRCRKLHNIAESVLIFDEAQMLPVPYLRPCVWSIAQLVAHYGCSAVLCTATQPSLAKWFGQYLGSDAIPELCPDVAGMHAFFRRVQYRYAGKLSDEALAARLQEEEQVLCVVNTRKHAQALYEMLTGEGCFHLSTSMCAQHRRAVLGIIRARLQQGLPCRVVSTSLIEAGVDVDFPVVWRALAGLDAMIQAGGRCNREGLRPLAVSTVNLFETDVKPPRMMEQNIAAAQKVMRTLEDIASPEAIHAYFQQLYHVLKGEEALDQKGILAQMEGGTMPFETVAHQFQLIETGDYTVYVPYGEQGAELVEALAETGPTRALLRKLGVYAVGVYPQQFDDLYRSGALERIGENIGILRDRSLYGEHVGLASSVTGGQGYII